MEEKHTKIKASDPALRYLQVQYSRREIFVNNLIGGVAWGLGATVGVAILLTVLSIVFHFINLVPFVGGIVTSIVDYVNQNSATLPKP